MLAPLIRPLAPGELPIVLSTWKCALRDLRQAKAWAVIPWAAHLDGQQFWSLVNYVIDKITVPSSQVFVGCHASEPETPCCWVVLRDSEVLFMYARKSILEDLELAATLQRELLATLSVSNSEPTLFDPYRELRR